MALVQEPVFIHTHQPCKLLIIIILNNHHRGIFLSMEASCLSISNSFIKTLDLRDRSPRIQSSSSPSPSIFCKKKSRIGSRSSITRCSLRSEFSGDDHREPPRVESDWRSFRARLIAEEQAADQKNQEISAAAGLGDRWAHPLHEPERGCLLIATEKLDGVHIFERTVILLLATGPIGPTGVILNRPSLMSIKETRSTDFAVAFPDRPLFFGGPLEEGIFLVGPLEARQDGVGKSGVFDEVMKGLYYGTKESVGCAAEMVKRSVVDVGDIRFFDGYCGWEKEQLGDEIREGYWSVVACSPTVIGFSTAGLWEEVLGLVGEKKVR